MRRIFAILICLLMFDTITAEEPAAQIKPIVPLAKIVPLSKVYENSKPKKPILIKSEKEAATYFPPAELKKLKAKVDFSKQVVLVFAWKGSGQDKLTFDVAESYPEQIHFKYRPGRTRDLRPHLKIYALRTNVKWSVKSHAEK